MNTNNYYKEPTKYFFEADIEKQKLLFRDFNGDKNQKAFYLQKAYDALSLIDTYMKSEVRQKMDEGDFVTGGYGDIQICNKIDKSKCLPFVKTYDVNKLKWMAEVYCVLQWKYNIYSSDIASVLSAKELYNICDLKVTPRDFAIKEYGDRIASCNFNQVPNCKAFDIDMDSNEEQEESYDSTYNF